jgi:hypothetical protein
MAPPQEFIKTLVSAHPIFFCLCLLLFLGVVNAMVAIFVAHPPPPGNIQSKSHASAKQKERELSAFGLVLLTTLMLRNSFRMLTRRYIRFSSVLSTSHPNKISTPNMARLVSSPAVAFATKLSSLPLLSHGLALSPIIFSVVLKQ